MDKNRIRDNRLWNLRQVVRALGGPNAAAKALGKFSSQISALTGINPERNIGDKLAAEIEAKLGIPPGGLDMDPPKEAMDKDPLIAQIVTILSPTSDDDKLFFIAMAEWFASRSVTRGIPPRSPEMINLALEADEVEVNTRKAWPRTAGPIKKASLPVAKRR